METREIGFLVAAIGLVLVAVGLLYSLGWLWWVGRLPGDIRFEGGNAKVYVPLTTMILLSVGLSVVAFVLRRLL